MKIQVFRDFRPCGLVNNYRRFGDATIPRRVGSCRQSTRRYISEDSNVSNTGMSSSNLASPYLTPASLRPELEQDMRVRVRISVCLMIELFNFAVSLA